MLKPQIRGKSGVPYTGQYILDNKEKGFVGRGSNFTQLVTSIRAYRYSMGLPCGLGLEDEIEQEVCLKYAAECNETSPLIPNIHNRRLSFQDVINGTRALIAFKVAGSPLVDSVEAARRAKICAACPWNVDFQRPCNFICGELKDLVLKIVGSSTTPHDDSLRSCAICSCHNQAQVWLPLEISTAGLSDRQKEQFAMASQTVGCWKQG